MTIEKSCVVKGCTGYPCYGFGTPSKVMRWACRLHKEMIWPEMPA